MLGLIVERKNTFSSRLMLWNWSLSGLQQTTLQHCQDTIAGLEETIAQLVASVKKLEKMICWCHDCLLSPGPHYAPGKEEEMVEDLEEKEEDSLEYKTNTPFTGGKGAWKPMKTS